MKKFKSILCFCLLVCLLVCTGFANEEGNLIANPQFTKDDQGTYSVWNTEGAFSVSSKQDAELGDVLSIDTQETQVDFYQSVNVLPETIYCFTLGIRGQGKAMISVRGLETAYLQEDLTGEWQYIQLYGLTGEDQYSVIAQFSLTNAENVEIAEISCLETDDVPEDATYVWLYDRQAYEEEQRLEEEAKQIDGSVPALLIAALYGGLVYGFARRKEKEGKQIPPKTVWMVLGGAFVVLSFFALCFRGHSTDINCFTAWASQAAEVGPWNFYTSGIWADYPPGYILVLWIVGLIGKLFGLASTSMGFVYLVKLPAILADLATAYLVYRLAQKRLSNKSALLLCALMAFNPMSILDSAVWGQIDSILTLLAVGSLWCYVNGKKPWSVALFVIGVLVKPQMLVFGPLLAAAFIYDIVQSIRARFNSFDKELEKNTKKALILDILKQVLKELGCYLLWGLAALLIIALPFSFGQEPLWLLKKYISAAGQYGDATVNAFNLYALFGGNWVSYDTELFFGITIQQFGTLMIVLMCAVAITIYIAAKDKKAIFPAAAILQWGIFLCSHAMHERYLFPAMLLLLISYCLYREKRLLAAFGIATAVTFCNSLVVLLNTSDLFLGTPAFVIAISLLNLLGFAVCFWACFSALWPK